MLLSGGLPSYAGVIPEPSITDMQEKSWCQIDMCYQNVTVCKSWMQITPYKPEFTIVIFIHYKPRIGLVVDENDLK